MHEIGDLQEFRAIKLRRPDVIVITDVTGTRTMHSPDCSFVNEKDFTQKVIANKRRNGTYFWFPTSEDAARLLKAKACSHCQEGQRQ